MPERAAPLSGLRVLDLSRILAGPWCTQNLADLGADVIKVERPGAGDDTRGWGPPFIKDAGGHDTTEAAYYTSTNRNKRSITLDMATQAGANIIRKLAAESDILVENFKVGGLKKYGLDYDSLKAINPRLIYCSEKGFLSGPYENRTALDEVTQMMGGLAYMTGPPGQPLRAGASVIDVTGGMFGVIGVLAALEQRHRTGRGQKVAASLFETTAYLVGQHMAQYAVTGTPAAPMPARVSAWAIYDVFQTRDEPVFIGVVTDALWEKFCTLFGLDELWADQTLRENNSRVQARARILPVIRELIGGMTRAEVIARLDGSGLPFAPIGKPEELFDDPHLAEGGLEPVTLEDGTTVRLPTIPLAMDGQRIGAAMAADGLQRVAQRPPVAIVDNQRRAAMVGDALGDPGHDRGGGGAVFHQIAVACVVEPPGQCRLRQSGAQPEGQPPVLQPHLPFPPARGVADELAHRQGVEEFVCHKKQRTLGQRLGAVHPDRRVIPQPRALLGPQAR